MEQKDKNFVDSHLFIPVLLVVLIGTFIFSGASKTILTSTNTVPVEQSIPAVVPTSNPDNTTSVTYKGEKGKTALELLEKYAATETSGSGINTFVIAINGYKPDVTQEFWAFYVNGIQAQVGAGSYKTLDTDIIEWKLEKIQPL